MDTYFNDVNDWLSVGGDLDLARDVTGQDKAETVAQLMAHGVTHVLDLRSEWSDGPDWAAAGLPTGNFAHVPIVDSFRYIPEEEWFVAVERFVERFWAEAPSGGRLYVHCHMGVNRGPSAAMLALLTIEPDMTPFKAFMQVRMARPVAGLVYAEAVGIRHLLNYEQVTEEDLVKMDGLPESVTTFSKALAAYWTSDLRQQVSWGIARYRSKEGSTVEEVCA